MGAIEAWLYGLAIFALHVALAIVYKLRRDRRRWISAQEAELREEMRRRCPPRCRSNFTRA